MDNKSSNEINHRSTEGLNPFEILYNTEDAEEQDFQRLKEKFRHNIFKPVVKPPAIYSFAGEIVGTSGNLSLVIGKAKSKKTILATLIVISAITGKNQTVIQVTLPEDKKKIVVFDTEQSDYHVWLMTNRILKHVEESGAKINEVEINRIFQVYKLRTAASVEERTNFIEQIIYNDNEIGMVIIDGIRDLLFDFNDPGESMEIVCSLMRWSQERNIHIL